jgi:iron complex outermembrane recepter protein
MQCNYKTYRFYQTNAQLYGLNALVTLHPYSIEALKFSNSFSLVHGFNFNPQNKNDGSEGGYLPFIPPPGWHSTVSYDLGAKSKVIKMITLKTDADVEHGTEPLPRIGQNRNSHCCVHALGCIC